ncbi:toprim domain-containing protein [Spirosoma terrae]|uniref:Zinc finger CHC2-type domain-containing protein n=1 Tax=Spirosoma terrae TaxID=1968276 RepID=A0A6L9L5T2_9BACT|nr:CHC2 zinc finger domain-containing protein [Spirosoma terrae]NDU94732.1 hypothetical protein [Spirosoma terrae]
MIPQTVIDEVKRVPITSYLQSKGVFPVHKLNSEINDYAYCSPLSQERTPSFFVNERDNVFNDFSTGEKGDVIRLVQKIERITFVNAVKRLQGFISIAEPLQFSPYEIANDAIKNTDFKITAVRTLQHPLLIEYVEKERGIPYAYAQPWVRQIHYTRKDKRYFGVGFRTDAGSWAVRNPGFKTWIGKSEITTIEVTGSKTVNVFEGFFNFLSALVYFGKPASRSTTIVLNSTSNIKQALPLLQNAVGVFCYLDNDKAGRKAVQDIQNAGCTVIDRSNLYSHYNDFNEFLKAR